MSGHPDVIVAGLGAMGSQALAECARRGWRAVGLDRLSPPHDQGSSHGRSRIIREAYFEDPIYVPLVQRAYERWAELEAETGTHLFRRTGGICYGPAQSELVTGARRSAALHQLRHDVLSAAEIRSRFPVLTVADDWIGVLEPRAGMLAPEAAIAAALTVAERQGARVHRDEPLRRWRQDGNGVVVETDRGVYRASHLILAAGMWMPGVLPELAPALSVQRNVLYWFSPTRDTAAFGPDRLPVFLGELERGLMWYGFPDTGDGIKVALHHQGATTSPDYVDRVVHPAEIAQMKDLLERFLPAANGPLRDAQVCTYTNTRDQHFIIDRHPTSDRVLVASPCSGHGFKFASAIGEVLADLTDGGQSRFDLRPFGIRRVL